MNLFTVIVWDRWGHGMLPFLAIYSRCQADSWLIIGRPIAWMVPSNATEATIDYFIAILWKHNPSIIPTRWMSDFCKEQLKVLRRYYPDSIIYHCWWHVLHTWQQHLVISHYKDLWALLKDWVHITEQLDFGVYWGKVQELAPKALLLTSLRLGCQLSNSGLLSGIQTRPFLNSVKRICLLNHMYISSQQKDLSNLYIIRWHHLLKGKFLEGKRN